MQIEVFTIADAATEFGGKLNLLGSFDTLNVEKLPGILPSFTIVLKVRANTSEKDTQKFEIDFLNPDGSNLIDKFTSSVNFNFLESIDSATAHILINLQGVPFPNFGKYVIKLTHEGVVKASLPLYVRKI